MVNALFKVKHGACALCGVEHRPLYVLNLTAGKKAKLDLIGKTTHTGICRACFSEIGMMLVHRVGKEVSYDLLGRDSGAVND